MLLKQLEAILRDTCQLERRLLVVGVSGGADSLCLMHALSQLGYPLLVGHLDHSLRPESADEARTVERLARQMGAAFATTRQDVAEYARQHKQSIEEAARAVRYRFLFDLAEQHQAQAVAVAHTADDQAETVLMHLLRGAALSGLGGMAYRSLPNPWSQTIPLVRPLLGFWRQEVLAYLATHNLQPLWDASNLDRTYYRNRLRHEVLPFLEELNPGLRRRLVQMATVLRDEEALIESWVQHSWEECVSYCQKDGLAFNLERLQTQPLAIQRRLLRRGITYLRPTLRNLDFAAIQRALEFVQAPPPHGTQDLVAGLRLERFGHHLWLLEWGAEIPRSAWPQIPPGVTLQLTLPGETALEAGWLLRAEVREASVETLNSARQNRDPQRAWCDAGRLQSPLLVRARRPGDRLRPLGMGGHSVKVSDFMINIGLPRHLRPAWPLVVYGEEIVWVVGHRLAEPFAVRESSTHLILLSLIPPRSQRPFLDSAVGA